MRRFMVFETPHKADPAWISPVLETFENGEYTQFADATELRDCVWNLQFELGRKSGQTEEEIRTMLYLESIGWTKEQMKAWRFWRQPAP